MDYRIYTNLKIINDQFDAKRKANKWGMWTIVDLMWTKQLADWIDGRKVLEVMAGRGWLAKALASHGVDIIATDNQSWNHSKHGIFDIQRIDAIAAVRQNDNSDILLIAWPPYNEPIATRTCDAWGTKRPIVYIGEGQNGCTADNEFFEHFYPDDDLMIKIPRWYGLYDYLEIGTWKK